MPKLRVIIKSVPAKVNNSIISHQQILIDCNAFDSLFISTTESLCSNSAPHNIAFSVHNLIVVLNSANWSGAVQNMSERPDDNSGHSSSRRSFKKTMKGTFRVFKQESFKGSSTKLRISSFKVWPRGAKESSLDLKGPCESANLLKEIPSLDFPKLKADLYIDLAYTNNLLRQRLHRDNLSNFVTQLTECLRLIRCRVATAVAYIQPDNIPAPAVPPLKPPPRPSSARPPHANSPLSTSYTYDETHPAYYNESRVILEAVSRFENAYVTFSAWLAELTSLKASALDGIVGQLPTPLNCDLPVGPLRSDRASDFVSTPINPVNLSSNCAGILPQGWTDSEAMQSSTIMSPIDVAEIMSRGNACFLAVQSAAESVFLSIEASGCDKPTTPLALSSSRISDTAFFPGTTTGPGRRSSNFTAVNIPVRAVKDNNDSEGRVAKESPTVSSSTPVPETSSHGLTPEDRQLLWQLWAQVEPLFDQNNTPPPKPPIPTSAEEPSSPPFSSAGESLATDSGIISDISLDLFPSTGTYTNVRADSKLNAYLRSLAEAVEAQQPLKPPSSREHHHVVNTSTHTAAEEESPYASLDRVLHRNGHRQSSSPPPPSLPPRNGKVNCGLNLNDCADLNLPHADDSDASEKENAELEEWRGKREDTTSVTVFGAAGDATPSSKPPTGPGRVSVVCSPNLGRAERPQAPSLGFQTSSVDGYLRTRTSRRKNPPSWEAMDTNGLAVTRLNGRLGEGEQGSVKQDMNPLSDKAMKEEVLNVVLQMHEKQFLKGRSANHDRPVSLPQSPSLPPRTGSGGCQRQFTSPSNDNITEPRCEANSKSDTEDDFELIEVNGKRYRRHFRRHIILQRHKCRQVVVAPSMSDGSGPDLSRQVAQSALQVCQMEEPYDYLPSSEWATALLTTLSGDDKSTTEGTQDPDSRTRPELPELVREPSKIASSSDSSASPKANMADSAVSNGSISPSKTMGNGFNHNLLNYMYRFGRSDMHDPFLDSRISRKVADFFQAKWRKRETAQGPHDRSKTVAYVQKYSQPTGTGTVIQRSTCVQQTCHVRMVGGLQELMQQLSSSVPVSIVCTPASTPKPPENTASCQLNGQEKVTVDREEKCMQTGDASADGVLSTEAVNSAAGSKSVHPLKIDPTRPHTVQQLYSCSSVTTRVSSDSPNAAPGSAPVSASCSKNGSPSTFRRRARRPSRRKASLEDQPNASNSPSDNSHSLPLFDFELCSVSLPTVEDAERLHPLLAELDATPFLDIENTESDTDLDIQAGTIDALIVYATSMGRAQRSFLLALDVFLFMYRTFMTSEDLINRLIQRYLLFQSSTRLQESVEEKTRLKICNFVVSYLIRVVSRLSQDLTPEIYALLHAFQERVLKDGHTALGKALECTLSGALKRMPTQPPLLQPSAQIPSTLPGIESPFYNRDLLLSEPCAFRRSHSIGAVAERTEPAKDLETTCTTLQSLHPDGGGGGGNGETTTLRERRQRTGGLWASARNSFSDATMGPAASPHLLQRSSSPSCSTFSDLELDCSQFSTSPLGGSCVSSPVMSKRPVMHSGVSRDERSSHSVVTSPVATITLTRSPRSSVPVQHRRRLSLLDIPAKLLAEQLTYLEAEKYKHLTLNELLDIQSLVETKAPGVAACAAQFSALSNWAATLLLEPPESQRDRHALKLLNTMDHLRALKNFNSFLAILCAFLLIPEDIFSKKTRARLARLRPYMQPPHFSAYRRELAESSPPLIPYLGLTLQNLIVLDQVNPIFLPKVPEAMAPAFKEVHGPIVNFWRCWKHFLIIDFFVKQENSDTRAAHYDIQEDRDVLDFIGDFQSAYPDFALRELINRRKRQAT
ncbi:hypothetical protein AAHC03_09932 [Spirometra sp. Aus1]